MAQRSSILKGTTLGGVSLQKPPVALFLRIDPLAIFWTNHQKFEHRVKTNIDFQIIIFFRE
jgi:hypothetical protein